MLLYTFGGYDDFKEIFELREHGNGVKSRRNQILLAFYKSPKLLRWCREHGDTELTGIRNMSQLRDACITRLTGERFNMPGAMWLNGRKWGSKTYYTDYMKGKTEDGDEKAIRYVRLDNDKVYKMKAGKMYRQLILDTKFGQMLPEQVVTWLCEELSFEWTGYNTASQYELHVNGNFSDIYDSEYLKGNFGSCMVNEDQHSFYADSVKAQAAYLTDEDEEIVARAIIFTEVRDEDTGNNWRLCERQYSSDGDEMLKQILVNRLIQGGYIDGYKRVGADCHSSRSFVDNEGRDLSDKRFSIECNLDFEDTLSYQDSFKWYDINNNRAYNFEHYGYTHMLNTTSSYIEDDRNYDEYHERYTFHDVVRVHCHGQEMDCDEEDLDDFIRVNGRWYHEDDVCYCDECEEAYVDGEGYYSEITDGDYCCEDCMREAEERYCEEHPDEYVWLNGEAVPRDEVIFCAHCGEAHRENDSTVVYSGLTDEDYCCDECKQAAERKFFAEHPDCGYGVCSECDDVKPLDEMEQNPDGTYTCHDCKEYAQKYSNLY